MSKNTNDTASKIADLINDAARDDSPAILKMAQMMLEMNTRQAQLAVEAMDRLQKESQETRALVRDVMFGKLAIFNLPVARQYASVMNGRAAFGSPATANKTSAGEGGPAASPDDNEEREGTPMSDEEIIRDIDPVGQRGGHGFVPPR